MTKRSRDVSKNSRSIKVTGMMADGGDGEEGGDDRGWVSILNGRRGGG